MPDLKAALAKAGLIRERTLREADAQEQLDADERLRKLKKSTQEKDRRMRILAETSLPDNFRREARKLLLADPLLVQEILNLAHERGMQCNKKGGTAIIGALYSLREALKTAKSDEERYRISNKLFTK